MNITVEERLVSIQTVPWPVVDFRELTQGIVLNGRQELVLVPRKGLLPEQIVHDIGRIAKIAHHLPVIVTETAQIGFQFHPGIPHHGTVIGFRLDLLVTARAQQKSADTGK